MRAPVDVHLFKSIEALGIRSLDTLLLHNWAHRLAYHKAIWRRLLDLQGDGRIRVLGALVYTPAEAKAALNEPAIGHLQIPFNLLDWRWKAAGIDTLVRKRKDVSIHARSALLQGLLPSDASVWARLQGGAEIYLNQLERLTMELGRCCRADLCFAYVGAQAWIDSIVVGVETQSQLDANLCLFQNPVLTAEECDRVERALTRAPDVLLNPSQWKLTV